ncbi:MAG TPA: hypothetical protein VGV17_16980 [Bosea sp. (in: a-proteobacteria)]|uniref:hypothetical protein n=1 Tax=Bosea sp. (in: a-proteobacteria) TaxID=1871050 RepID=UPI002DDCF8DE|nr:hypothetical protein [Bosea sp. (in: a-proteobacteria)]HEV2555450.1 hypothetical protein [Bosea sp. (in: a-proteobacteria)]
MARKRTPEAPIEAPAAERVTAPTMTKAAAVRAAVAAGKSKPADAVQWIKEQHGIEITPQHFSSYKSSQARKDGVGSSGGRRGRRPAATGFAPISSRHRVNSGGGVDLAKQLKSLVTQYGADEVSGMLAVLRD